MLCLRDSRDAGRHRLLSQADVVRRVNGNVVQSPLFLPQSIAMTDAQAQYWASREALIAQERSRRYDAVKAANLNAIETAAGATLEEIKIAERTSLWNSEVNLTTFPGMPFREAIKNGLRDTKVWQIIQHMPKGALLHCHMDGTVQANWLIQEAIKYDDIFHIKADGPLTEESLYTVGVCFAALPIEQRTESKGDVFAADYDGHQWMSLREARKRCPLKSVYSPPPMGFVEGVDIPQNANDGTPEGAFDSWLHSLMTMTPCPRSKPIRTSPEAWDRVRVQAERLRAKHR